MRWPHSAVASRSGPGADDRRLTPTRFAALCLPIPRTPTSPHPHLLACTRDAKTMPTPIRRRTLLGTSLVASLALGPFAARSGPAAAQGPDPRMGQRAVGNPRAKVVVHEWFSLTCTHCARFAQDVFPEVKAKLIDTGRVFYVFKDFPLDQVALAASMVARSLPPERYEPFVLALLSSQDRWAFGQNVDPQAELQKMAALAGMPKATFDAAINDETLKHEILAEQDRGATALKINATPTFVFGTPDSADKSQFSGELDYDGFLKRVTAAVA